MLTQTKAVSAAWLLWQLRICQGDSAEPGAKVEWAYHLSRMPSSGLASVRQLKALELKGTL